VSGELPERIVVEADGTGTVASFVRALGTLPREHWWVLVGGFAVNLRISTLHRLTGDVDTLTSKLFPGRRLIAAVIHRLDGAPSRSHPAAHQCLATDSDTDGACERDSDATPVPHSVSSFSMNSKRIVHP
jgi:hypothetical protein